MRIIGFDPGIARTGWGVIEVQSGKCKVQDYGCVETSPNLSTEKRLLAIYQKLTGIIRRYKPDALAIEELFFNTNAKTAFIVGQARGVILLCAAKEDLPIATYTPLQVKMAITGYGRAEKKQVGKMVATLLRLKSIPKPDDVTDALAVALTHAFSKTYARIKNSSHML
ncbi:MAG: crossover junction endodeoxyribonuclease RuvC [Candidatus Levybacteria bacterium RIFCSPHIGHO2_02_FULL_42_12]|nr:MAG: crossover junction endodeoxyribonuclease RuvC [Candidatus Levybacteria bacterium RIFCSPHIGHO2_02_FULL_42_12]